MDFPDAIAEAVGKCDVLLALIGDKWLSATRDGARRLDDPLDYVRLEIAAALARDTVVVPVLIEDAPMPRRDELPEALAELADRNALRLTDDAWNEGISRLTQFLGNMVRPAPGASGRSGARSEPTISERLVHQPQEGKRRGKRLRTVILGVFAVVGALAAIGLLSDPPEPPPPTPESALGGEITDVRLSSMQPCCTYAVQAHILGFKDQECTVVVSVIDRVSGQAGDPAFAAFVPEANDDRATQHIPIEFDRPGQFTIRFVLIDPKGVELDREEIPETIGP